MSDQDGGGLRGLFEVVASPGIAVAVHDGVEIQADLYTPAGAEHRPALVLYHGGAFIKGSRASYERWGRFLASHGFVALSADYRLASPGSPTYPQVIFDAMAPVQFLKGSAQQLGVDPARIGAMGGSAGAYLAAMVALTRQHKSFANPYPDEFAAISPAVDVVIPMAGSFDMLARWEHDRLTRPPQEQVAEILLGGTPSDCRATYYEASPIYHASSQNASGTKWLIAFGTEDNVAPPADHSLRLARALTLAGALVRLVPLTGAPHFWYTEGGVDESNPFNQLFAKRLLTFLHTWCEW